MKKLFLLAALGVLMTGCAAEEGADNNEIKDDTAAEEFQEATQEELDEMNELNGNDAVEEATE